MKKIYTLTGTVAEVVAEGERILGRPYKIAHKMDQAAQCVMAITHVGARGICTLELLAEPVTPEQLVKKLGRVSTFVYVRSEEIAAEEQAVQAA